MMLSYVSLELIAKLIAPAVWRSYNLDFPEKCIGRMPDDESIFSGVLQMTRLFLVRISFLRKLYHRQNHIIFACFHLAGNITN
jgi:hypothetical protein